MMGKHENHQHRFMFLSLNQYVPKDHLLRQIEELVDFTFIYEKVQHLYSFRAEVHRSCHSYQDVTYRLFVWNRI